MTGILCASAGLQVDESRMQRDRFARLQRMLRVPVFNMHNTFRWALVPAESAPVPWEYPGSLHATATRWEGDLREARG